MSHPQTARLAVRTVRQRNRLRDFVACRLCAFFVPRHQGPGAALFLSFSWPFFSEGSVAGAAVGRVGVLDDPEPRRLDSGTVVQGRGPKNRLGRGADNQFGPWAAKGPIRWLPLFCRKHIGITTATTVCDIQSHRAKSGELFDGCPGHRERRENRICHGHHRSSMTSSLSAKRTIECSTAPALRSPVRMRNPLRDRVSRATGV